MRPALPPIVWLTLLLGGCSAGGEPKVGSELNDGGVKQGKPLADVKTWAYQINNVEDTGVADRLVASRYDMIVVDNPRTSRGSATYDSKGMVAKLHASLGKNGKPKRVLAYVDVGEAEELRTYWKSDWRAPTNTTKGSPDFMIAKDPDGWSGNYPVAYWDPRWKDLVINGADSMMKQVVDDGFDGVYLDWIEAFSARKVAAEATRVGVDPAVEMIKFVREIAAYTRARAPNFIVIAQNAPDLGSGHPEYFQIIDGISMEPLHFDGSADTRWDDAASCDQAIPQSGPNGRQWWYDLLDPFKNAGVRVLVVDYACTPANVQEAYSASASKGYLGYVTRRPLDRLTSTPPPGY
jgi:cysteinyl-tRNA synthetase, unknown class